MAFWLQLDITHHEYNIVCGYPLLLLWSTQWESRNWEGKSKLIKPAILACFDEYVGFKVALYASILMKYKI